MASSASPSALSARDVPTQNLCERVLGIKPILVCDPTFLTPTPRVDNEKIRRLTKKPYILFYYCNGIPKELKEKIIFDAHKKAASDGHDYTDDTEIWGRYCGNVKLVTGDPKNIKITYPGDLEKAQKQANG